MSKKKKKKEDIDARMNRYLGYVMYLLFFLAAIFSAIGVGMLLRRAYEEVFL